MMRKNKSIKLNRASKMAQIVRKATLDVELSGQAQEKYVFEAVEGLVEEMLADAMAFVGLADRAVSQFQSIEHQISRYCIPFELLEHIQEVESPIISCDQQPPQAPSLFGRYSVKKQERPMSKIRLSCTSSIKTKARSCDSNHLCQKYIQKHKLERQRLKQSHRQSLVPLPLTPRSIEHQDFSAEIQEWLWRKKDLNNELKREERLLTQVSKRSKLSSFDRKEKKGYYQNDDGRACQMYVFSKAKEQAKGPFAQISYLAGQTAYEGLKKKTIMQHTVVKAKRKRRHVNLQNTCVLVEQIKQTQGQPSQGLSTDIVNIHKGVTLKLRQSFCSKKSIRLPTVR